MAINKTERRTRIKRGIRKKVKGTGERPRLSIFRSNTGIYAQLIDDVKGVTVGSASTKDLKDSKKSKVEISGEVGKLIAKMATDKGIKEIVFDRGGYRFHGRVKALAEGAREGGLKF